MNNIVTINGSHIESMLGCSESSSRRMQQPTVPAAITAISSACGVRRRRKIRTEHSGMAMETSGG